LENVPWRTSVPTGRPATDIGGSAPPLVVIGEPGTGGKEVEFLPDRIAFARFGDYR